MVEQLAREAAEGTPIDPAAKRPTQQQSHDYDFFVRDLQQYFPTPVKFSRNASGKGSITLKFDNDEQLMQLVGAFENIKK